MAEGRAPISSSRIATGDIAQHTFAVVRRGFDSDEVRSYLQSVSRSLEALEAREEELRAALAEAEERAAHPVVDEATLTASLGQHSAQILRHAHEEAARIVVQAQEGAATLLRETQSQVDELQARTEASSAERVVEVELLVANAEQEARMESERIIADAIAKGEEIITQAKDEGRALLDQVQEARRRVLSDLAARRRSLGVQIEQLRAARDEMAASVHGVRDRVDGILTHLSRTDDEARAAAQAVADQFRLGSADLPHDQDEVTGEAPPTGPTPAVREPGGAAGEDEGGAPGPSVDELFARIRAGSGATAAAARADDADAGPAAPGGGAGEATRRRRRSRRTPERARRRRRRAAPEEAEPVPGPDDPLIARRGRAARPGDVAPEQDDQAHPGRRAEPVARPAAQCAGARRRRADGLRGRARGRVRGAAARSHLDEAFAAGTVFVGAGAATIPRGDAVEQSSVGTGACRRDDVAAPGRGGDGGPGRPGRCRLPRMAR